MKPCRVYISGKISDLPIEQARQKFANAVDYLRFVGHDPVNPMELAHDNTESWARCMAIDIDALKTCDAIFMLPDWKDSRGAALERELADIWGLQIIESSYTLENQQA